jgi:Zn-dependent protease
MAIKETLLLIPGILLGFSFHEYAHAQMAVWLGDDTPKQQGRLSVSPLAHIDILGFILILLAGFGWAKPVQINESNFKNRKRDDILVSLSGPAMNLLIAIFFLILMKGLSLIPASILPNNLHHVIMEVFN